MDIFKRSYFIGLAVYVVLLVLAVVYYLERIVFIDAACSVFYMAKDSNFAVQIYRFGDGFARIFPLLCIKAKLPLTLVSIAFSVGFVSVFLVCYLICGILLKRYRFALVILLVNILFLSDAFYWPTAQSPQAIALTMVLFSLLWGKKWKTLRLPLIVISVLLIVTIVFFHPLMIVVMFYSICFFLLRNDIHLDRRILLAIGAVFVATFVFKLLFYSTGYDESAFRGLNNFITLFPSYFDTYATHRFLSNCLEKFYWIPIVFSIVLFQYISKKEYLKAGFFSGTVLGYILLVNTCYPGDYTPLFYIEAQYLPLGFFLGLPLVFDVLPNMNRNLALALMVLIMITGCLRIQSTHVSYTERLNWEREFLKKYGGRKMIVSSKKLDVSRLKLIWGTSYEFWLLSSIESGKFASILISDNTAERRWAKDVTKSLIVQWDMIPYDRLNSVYFKPVDTVSGYIVDPELFD